MFDRKYDFVVAVVWKFVPRREGMRFVVSYQYTIHPLVACGPHTTSTGDDSVGTRLEKEEKNTQNESAHLHATRLFRFALTREGSAGRSNRLSGMGYGAVTVITRWPTEILNRTTTYSSSRQEAEGGVFWPLMWAMRRCW